MAASAAVARRYAKALLALAREEERVEAVLEELGTLVELVESEPELARVLLRPLFPAEQRRAVLQRLSERLELSPLVGRFTSFLIDQRRMLALAAIRDEYARLADQEAGRTKAVVRAASPLAPDQLEQLRGALARRTGREVQVEVQVDPDLIGGVVARVGDLVFDGSLRTQLAQLRAGLTNG